MNRFEKLDNLMKRYNIEDSDKDDFIKMIASMLIINSVSDDCFDKTLKEIRME